ncbi:hypothetical protein PAQ31011_04847 [Pandoraea aquatica]|uniref:Uncharacterized protein n=1 Tax=Pandoraea aquatica TaxID=2508290 RepID=A0A5E4YXG3_9BURK|nr:hypothetical protein [Pandoraea aquatica]VVE53148.1 hypothetical protein PAQ31011_04847 [Pandoraea aquatica]
MLQISSGKFFTTEERWETPHRASLYTNCGLFPDRTITTQVGTILPVKPSGDLRAVTCEVIERLPKLPGGPHSGELVATSGDSLIQDFAALLSFCFKAIVTPDQYVAQRLLFAQRPPLGMVALPKQYLRHTFDTEIAIAEAQIVWTQTFIEKLIGASRARYSGAMRAIQRYVAAVHRLGDDLELSYTLLVASIESLAQEFDQFEPTWNDYAQEKRTLIDRALTSAPQETSDKVRGAVLAIEHVAAARRFREFVHGHLPSSFYRGEATDQQDAVGKEDLDAALKIAYDLRSKHVHTLAPLPSNLKGMPTYNDVLIIDGKPTLTIQGLARVARSVICEFVSRSENVERETYDFWPEVPGRLTVQLSPAMWITNEQFYTVENVRLYLNGYLSLLAHAWLTGSPLAADMRHVLKKIERLVPRTKKPRERLPMLALYYIFGSSCSPESHEYLSKFLRTYSGDYFSPSIESLLAHMFAEAHPNWSVEESESLLAEYMKQRHHKNSHNFGPLFGAALTLFVAELRRATDDEPACRRLITQAVENFPNFAALREFEARIQESAIPPIVIDKVLPPKR